MLWDLRTLLPILGRHMEHDPRVWCTSYFRVGAYAWRIHKVLWGLTHPIIGFMQTHLSAYVLFSGHVMCLIHPMKRRDLHEADGSCGGRVGPVLTSHQVRVLCPLEERAHAENTLIIVKMVFCEIWLNMMSFHFIHLLSPNGCIGIIILFQHLLSLILLILISL